MIFSGYLFGLFGLPLSLISITLGSLVPYGVARFIKSSILRERALKYIDQIQVYIDKNQFVYFTMIRMIPFTPASISSAIGGIFDIKIPIFIVCTLIGYLPMCLTLVLIGKQIENFTRIDNKLTINIFNQPEFILTTILIIIVFILPTTIIKKYNHTQTSNKTSEN
jgi:uncharacterized membrane protein YdjX (TVP38/TMEM64 family)